ncbi:MAG: restriction endonuclease [Deltaproteobacteria bacterium HGW-Deltaproteobacteria-21]|nr:MAG: restriction endonuclease [Deltaproteobacteria bacterium HGW-Deltaproteobacteria-21]
MVRAGRNAALVEEFEQKGYVGVGWTEIGDLSRISSKKDLQDLHKKEYADEDPRAERLDRGMLVRFRFEMKIGDRVLTYNPELRQYLIGEIKSDYKYRPNSPGDYNHIRDVEWKGKVSRDDLSVVTKNTVGAIMALFQLNEAATSEFNELLSGKKPAALPEEIQEKEPELEQLRKETVEKSREFVKDRIQKLQWDEMQDLVAGILRAMGYKTRVSPNGPDRGSDIVASPDGLGLEQPRIRVEVKHRNEIIGAPILRSFIGGLRQSDRGLYVSTGGFTKEAKYEAERATIPVTLLDIDDLAELLMENYDKADTETRALVPLRKIYWPA